MDPETSHEAGQIENVARQFSTTALNATEEDTPSGVDLGIMTSETVTPSVLFDNHPYSMYSATTHPLNTLVDMALALELGARPTTSSKPSKPDHTYSLKSKKHTNRFLSQPSVPQEAKDTDKVSSEKDHTYASNTIGFRYSSHRGKSASEESLLQKSTQSPAVKHVSARKCTSAETFVFPDLPPPSSSPSSSPPHATSRVQSSNSATLPRSKSKPREAQRDCDDCAIRQPSKPDIASCEPIFPVDLDSDSGEASPPKNDHTYAKYGDKHDKQGIHGAQLNEKTSDIEDCTHTNLISRSAPVKMGLVDLGRNFGFGATDHTYDKLSSAKIKGVPPEQHKSNETLQSIQQSSGCHSPISLLKCGPPDADNSADSVSPCVSAMDWQPLEYIQAFEKHFSPSDHTYTTVS